MTEDSCPKPSEEPAAAVARQRKKRKWDQPAESLISVGFAVPGALPSGVGLPTGLGVPGIVPFCSPVLVNSVAAACATAPQLYQAPALQQTAAAIIQKISQPKIQDELIAREIVINDADAAIRCKLTKRQTQEEIQKCTGAVVITRGRYRPPNALPDNDKPLFLHISSGAHLYFTGHMKTMHTMECRISRYGSRLALAYPMGQSDSFSHDAFEPPNGVWWDKNTQYVLHYSISLLLHRVIFFTFALVGKGGIQVKDTAERIKAVDHAASIVEEFLKHGQSSQLVSSLSPYNSGGQVIQPLTKCIYLGFDPDPSFNIAVRIRGPNDQFINHIMNETGVTVILRGRGSGYAELLNAGEAQECLHLYLSGSNPKSLEDARILAENLLDTICLECGISRMSACKAYKAVPPPLKLLDGVESSASVSIPPIDSATTKLSFSTATPVSLGSNISPPGSVLPSISGGTSYSGYGGIYPQATPLQQVALALRQAPASASSIPATSVFPATSTCTVPKVTSAAGPEKDKRSQRRKFQELPVASNSPTASCQNSRQGSESLKPGVSLDDLPVKNASSMSPPKLVQLHCNGILPPCPRSTPLPPPQTIMPPPPPPPPKFTATKLPPKDECENGAPKAPSTEPVPDTLMKLMEYGDDDEDADVSSEEYSKCDSTLKITAKPFWAV